MLDGDIIDKKVISIHIGDKTSIDIDLIDNIRNVVAIKLLKVYIESSDNINNLNMYYLHINDYKIVDMYHSLGNVRQSFAMIPFDPNNTVGDKLIASYNSLNSTEFRNNTDSYVANPLISNLNKLRIQLLDINGNPPTGINKFFLQIVIYSQFAKLTMR